MECAAPRRALGAVMRHRALPLFLLAALTPSCVAEKPRSELSTGVDAPASLLVRAAPENDSPLVFPPEDRSKRERPPLGTAPSEGGLSSDPPEVSEPVARENEPVAITEDRLHIRFTMRMALPKGSDASTPVAALPGTLKLTPEIKARVRWLDPYTLELAAEKPLPVGERLRVSLGDVRSENGQALESPWQIDAVARATVAGKVLSYTPKIGEPRLVAMHPHDGAKVSTRPEIAVLYDQPIALSRALSLLSLRPNKGRPVPFTASHPLGPTFQGIPVDRRHVVLLTPVVPLEQGEKYWLRAAASTPEGTGDSLAFSVAAPLEVVGVECASNRDDDCSVEGKTLHTKGTQLTIMVNNALKTPSKEMKKLLRVSPEVANLSVYSYGEDEGARIMIDGEFEPSKHYEVSLVGLVDRYGSRLKMPYHAALERAPVDASITMPSGVLLLDEARMRRFELTSRNVQSARLLFWPVADSDLASAVRSVHASTVPQGAPALELPVPIEARENELVTTPVDLAKALDPGRRYLAAVRVKETAFDADPPAERGPSPLALVFPGNAESLAVHVEKLAAHTVVHVAKLSTGEPVGGAVVELLDGFSPRPITAADGLALLGPGASGLLAVTAGKATALIDLQRADTTAEKLFPSLAAADDEVPAAARALLFSDRGIYRPGATIELFAGVRKSAGEKLLPVAGEAVLVKVLGPSSELMWSGEPTTDDLGGVTASIAIPKNEKLGRHRIIVESKRDGANAVLGESIVQVAEFEAPRFTVDVDARASDARTLRASIFAKYLFGAAMDGAAVAWTARREAAAIAEGPFAGAGFSFRPAPRSQDERAKNAWARAGQAKTAADGKLSLEQRLSLEGTVGPQRFVVEAEVTDSSNRAIAGRAVAIVHPAERYAGLRVARRWTAPGERIPVELAVVDRDGRPALGAAVSAVVRRVEYTSIARRDAGGALAEEWTRRVTVAGRCNAKSAALAVTCDVVLPEEGNYEVTAEVDGHPGGTQALWAWDEHHRSSGLTAKSRGRALEVVTDKATYAPGQTARLFVTSPFEDATAIVSTDSPGAKPRAQRIEGAAGVVEILLSSADAPHVHAMVTLLPRAANGGAAPDYRVGAVRLPVALTGARLALEVTPAKASYRPAEQAEIALRVADGGAPVSGAQLAIAVVDEGVLRLTGYHAPDPAEALRPAHGLAAKLFDTRAALADLVAQSHVAGDGDSGGNRRGESERSLTSARRNFAETAFWKADVRTDSEGRATVRFPLPDNLTTFRVMAIALDRDGKGAASETSFTVSKPVLLAPALPRFVSLGDSFEAAALVHSNVDVPSAVTVTLAGQRKEIALPPRGHARAGFAVRVSCAGDAAEGEIAMCPAAPEGKRAALHFAFEARGEGGATLDAVEQAVPATFAGLDERPRIDGAFRKSRSIALRVPPHAVAADGAGTLVIALGAQMWPELGERLRYLLDYPHGCVEQTTSSTLPLLAARDIAPKIGMDSVSDADLKVKIRAGLDRLATMRTASGGLAYWPGGAEPNTYGTAYAIRALVLAKAAGIEPPAELLDGMADYLKEHMFAPSIEPEVQAAIAQSLAELGRLEPSASDSLFDRRNEQTVFGSASLALALSALPGQEDRVAYFIERVEAGIDEAGELRATAKSEDFYYYGSPQRTKAQAAMALRRLRPNSPALRGLVRGLASATGSYTTQATAYSLLALGEELRRLSGDTGDARVLLDGKEIAKSRDLPGGGRQFEIPLDALAGRDATLELRSDAGDPVGFIVRAAWRRPAEEVASSAFRTPNGPAVYRVYTDAKGAPVDLENVHAGDVLRVALLARRPASVDESRYGYIAITDRLPAGFEAVQQDLATVAAQPSLTAAHPLAGWFSHADERPSFMEMHDDRVSIYFDSARGDDVVTSYLMRATTPGRFAVPPATAELMYEPDSLGASEPSRVAVR